MYVYIYKYIDICFSRSHSGSKTWHYQKILMLARNKRPRSSSCPHMSVACRVWLASSPNRYSPKRSRSSPSRLLLKREADDGPMEVDWRPSRRGTITFEYRTISMDDIGIVGTSRSGMSSTDDIMESPCSNMACEASDHDCRVPSSNVHSSSLQ